MNKKILIASTKAITINVFLDYFINSAYKKKHRLSFLCSDSNNINNQLLNKSLNDSCTSISLPRNTLELINVFKVILILIKIRSFFKINKFDIIFIHTPLISHLIRIATFGLNLNICYFVHGYRFHTKLKFTYRVFFFMIEYFLSFNTNQYITINKEDMKYTKKYFSKNLIFLKGIGIEMIDKDIPTKEISNSFKIGVIAGYKKSKGYDDIIYVAKKLHDNSKIQFISFGYQNPKKYLKIINKLKLTNIEVNKFVHNIYSEIDKFDILLHLSKREGLSTVTLQSLHRGVPVIGYDIRGVRDLIYNIHNGMLVDIGQKEKIVDIINFLFHNKSLYYSLQKRALLTIDESYSKNSSQKILFEFMQL